MAGSLRVARVAELSARQVAGVSDIYRQAFPPHLRVPFAGLAAEGPADLFLAGLEGQDPVAFAAFMRLDRHGWVFLRYFGVAANRRRQGAGRQFWNLLRVTLREAGWPDRIAFEVEDPDHARDADERQVCQGRIEFWRTCGCVVLPVRGYVMPDISGLADPEPMLLMTAGREAGPALQTAGLAHVVRAIYEGRYGLGPSHPLVVRALEALANPAASTTEAPDSSP
jgi:hypothetical protein